MQKDVPIPESEDATQLPSEPSQYRSAGSGGVVEVVKATKILEKEVGEEEVGDTEIREKRAGDKCAAETGTEKPTGVSKVPKNPPPSSANIQIMGSFAPSSTSSKKGKSDGAEAEKPETNPAAGLHIPDYTKKKKKVSETSANGMPKHSLTLAVGHRRRRRRRRNPRGTTPAI